MSEWISVEDELPDGECIAWQPNGKDQRPNIIQQCTCISGKFTYGYYDNRLYEVTHWMPLPEPPITNQ